MSHKNLNPVNSARPKRVAIVISRSNGEPLVAGKTVTGFANVEGDFADQAM